MREYFNITRTTDGTYLIADKNKNIFDWGLGVRDYGIKDARPKYIKVKDKDGKWSLYNHKGHIMPGAEKVDGVYLDNNGSYRTHHACNEKHYDNGVALKIRIKRTAKTLLALSVLGTVVGLIGQCRKNEQAKEATENPTLTVYIGSANDGSKYGESQYFLSTDKNDKDAEFVAKAQTDYAAGVGSALQKGDKGTVGGYRAMGFDVLAIEKKERR